MDCITLLKKFNKEIKAKKKSTLIYSHVFILPFCDFRKCVLAIIFEIKFHCSGQKQKFQKLFQKFLSVQKFGNSMFFLFKKLIIYAALN